MNFCIVKYPIAKLKFFCVLNKFFYEICDIFTHLMTVNHRTSCLFSIFLLILHFKAGIKK